MRDNDEVEDVGGAEDPSEPTGRESALGGSSRPGPAAPRCASRFDTVKNPLGPNFDSHVGRVIAGRYALQKLIARGGMGRVYQATQLQLGRGVAVKLLSPELQEGDAQFPRRFFLEAAIASRISHPNVVTVHDYGEGEQGELFMAMELLKGRTLSQVIKKEAPLAPIRLLNICIQIARALREAHAQGVIHRDLKPGNVMLVSDGDDPDFVKVLDFGLVKLVAVEGRPVDPDLLEPPTGQRELTHAGILLGSPRYMSPEQIRGEPLDARTDIYSFGILLFQMVTGRPPFTGATSVDLIYKHVHEPAPRPRDVLPGVRCPSEIEDIIERCLEKDPSKRFASMPELIVELKRARFSITGADVFGPLDTGFITGAVAAALPGVTRTDPGRATRPSRPFNPQPTPSSDPDTDRSRMNRQSQRPQPEATFLDAGLTSAGRKQQALIAGISLCLGFILAVGTVWMLSANETKDPIPPRLGPAPARAAAGLPLDPAPTSAKVEDTAPRRIIVAEEPLAIEAPEPAPPPEPEAEPKKAKRANSAAPKIEASPVSLPSDAKAGNKHSKPRARRFRDNPY